MRVPEPDEEQPLAWNAVLEDTPIISSDGEKVGVAYEVLGAEDIFHGLVLHSVDPGNHKLISADQVGEITNRKITVRLTSEEMRALPAYQPEESFSLGLVGLFRKHLGWIEDIDERG